MLSLNQKIVTLTLVMSSGLTAPGSAQSHPRQKTSVRQTSPSSSAARRRSRQHTLAAGAGQGVILTVHAASDVKGTTFTLGEIADLRGSDPALIAQLRAVEIGTSPLPGLTRSLMPGEVLVHLRAHHLDGTQVTIIAPPEFAVRRVARQAPTDKVTQAALTAARDAIKELPEATLEVVPSASEILLPSGELHLLVGAVRGEAILGTLTVPVALVVDGHTARTIDVTLRVHRKVRVLVANHTLEPHQVLMAEDLSLVTVDLPSGFTRPVRKLEEAVGKRTTRRITADTPLPADALETPPAVEANSRVTLSYEFGMVRITAPGLAQQTGKIGDTIRVYATDTHRELDGVIVDSHTVRIADSTE